MSTLVTTTFIATCKSFNSGTPDKNGKMPVILNPIAGQSPRGINVLSGTVAENEGFGLNKCYAVKATETAPYEGENGPVRSFNFTIIGEVSPLEAMNQSKSEKLTYILQPQIKAESQPVEVDA